MGTFKPFRKVGWWCQFNFAGSFLDFHKEGKKKEHAICLVSVGGGINYLATSAFSFIKHSPGTGAHVLIQAYIFPLLNTHDITHFFATCGLFRTAPLAFLFEVRESLKVKVI